MKKCRVFLFLCGPMLVSVLAGPLAVAARQGQNDSLGVYLLLSQNPEATRQPLQMMGVYPVGPSVARFGVLVTGDDGAVEQAMDAGYWLVPAQILAALCGFGQVKEDRYV
ncbi:hypothetical protein [Ascidiaceihabitans donghaensis]|uniref:hypothetical protein n=1 Tax=Ascidiaceihabitans donghaensis TaxID=1510460 RepID=UPI0011B1E15C|nr:hypothetical protein [Ascidiaceihabitans donghaensis]